MTWLGRTMRYCTTCRCRRRFIVRLYEWYSSRWICGGCGYTFVSDEGRRPATKVKRATMRRLVREMWPVVPRLHDTACEIGSI